MLAIDPKLSNPARRGLGLQPRHNCPNESLGGFVDKHSIRRLITLKVS